MPPIELWSNLQSADIVPAAGTFRRCIVRKGRRMIVRSRKEPMDGIGLIITGLVVTSVRDRAVGLKAAADVEARALDLGRAAVGG